VIIDLPSTTSAQINARLVELRKQAGAMTLGRVLTLVTVTDDGQHAEEAIEAAVHASREHPCRVIVVARGFASAAARFDAQVRVGGDAGASEVLVLRLYGALVDHGASCVGPLLLPDAPIVAWWPHEAPERPAADPIGCMASRRITDAAAGQQPTSALARRRATYTAGDSDLAWTRLTNWRALLAATLDLPPYEQAGSASVTGAADSPSTDLLAGWLAAGLGVPVQRKTGQAAGVETVAIERRSGPVTMSRTDGKTAWLHQPGQPERTTALRRRAVAECLAEELHRLDPDEIYAEALEELPNLERASANGSASRAPETQRAQKGDT
jgi:glucose-6-phosphate dehydrogenase assembly protein OpcA